jgi:hypothetical protein
MVALMRANGWTAGYMAKEVFLEEYNDFVSMGLSPHEIARAFDFSMDTLEHRLRRYGVI